MHNTVALLTNKANLKLFLHILEKQKLGNKENNISVILLQYTYYILTLSDFNIAITTTTKIPVSKVLKYILQCWKCNIRFYKIEIYPFSTLFFLFQGKATPVT